MLRKHQRRNFLSLSLWRWALSQFRWVHTRVLICTDRAHRSWMRTAFLAMSWQRARVHTWITSRWFYLFCFFHSPFPSQSRRLSRRWYDARQVVAPSNRFASFFLCFVNFCFFFSLPRNYSMRCCLSKHSMIIGWYLHCRSIIETNYRQLKPPSFPPWRLFIHLTDYLNTSAHTSPFHRPRVSINRFDLKRVASENITGPGFLTSSNDLWKRYHLVSILRFVYIANNFLLSPWILRLASLVVHMEEHAIKLMRNIWIENLRRIENRSTNFSWLRDEEESS